MHRFEEKNLYREIFKDFVILPGGADISPSLYGKKNYKSYVSNSSIEADRRHIEIYKDAVRKGKPLLCICRGLQLISALQGLTLIQDLRHPGGHNLTVRNLDTDEFTDTIKVNSIHHQLDVHKFNFGDITWWDRLFGTFKEADDFAPECGFPKDNETKVWDILKFKDVYDS